MGDGLVRVLGNSALIGDTPAVTLVGHDGMKTGCLDSPSDRVRFIFNASIKLCVQVAIPAI